MLHLFGALAQFERSLIKARTRDGLAAARDRGARFGRPPLDPEKVQAALLLIDGGMTPVKAAEAVGLGRSTVYRAVQERDEARAVALAAELAARSTPPLTKPKPKRKSSASR